jgi:hypothetical protein
VAFGEAREIGMSGIGKPKQLGRYFGILAGFVILTSRRRVFGFWDFCSASI